MRPILRSTPALLLVLLAAACGETTNSGESAGESASNADSSNPGAAGTSSGAGGGAAKPMAPSGGDTAAANLKLTAAAGGRPAMLDTGIDLSHLRDTSAGGGTAFPEMAGPSATVQPPTPAAQAAAQLPPGGLELVSGDEITHFGELLEGDKAETSWRLRSTGENPLVIERVRPSCGCTAAEIELVAEDGTRSVYTIGQEIPVGTEFEIGASINTANRQGAFASNVAIYTNDPASPIRLQLQADVKAVLEVAPQNLDFGTITSGDMKDGVVTISTSVLDPFHLELDTANIIEPLSAELTPVDPDAEGRSKTWELAVKLGPDTPEGMRRYMLRMKSDVPQMDSHGHGADEEAHGPSGAMRELVCNVTANVTALVVASPNFISLGVVRPGEPVERSVKIETLDPDFTLPESPAYRFQSLTGGEFTGAEYFSIEVAPAAESDGRALDVTLKLDGLPDEYSGSFGGMVTLEVDHPTKKEINVRFSGVAKPGIPTSSQDN